MHNIGQPNKIVRRARIFFLAAFAAAAPLVAVASTLTISGTPPTSAVVGQPYYFNPKASGGNGHALTWSVLHEPNWTGFSTTTGYFNGTPTAQYVGNVIGVTISVTDGTTKVSLPSPRRHRRSPAHRRNQLTPATHMPSRPPPRALPGVLSAFRSRTSPLGRASASRRASSAVRRRRQKRGRTPTSRSVSAPVRLRRRCLRFRSP